MGKYFYTDKNLIGLDINTTDIKIMAIDPKRWTVVGYGAIDVNPVKMKRALEEGGDYISNALKRLVSEKVIGNLPSSQVVLGIPTVKTYSRTITVPADAAKNIQEVVELEANQYIPIPLSLLYIDYEILERTKESVTIIMNAIPKGVVDNCLDACKQASLTVNVIEPSINAVARLLENTEEGHLTTAIIDIGPANTDIAILDRSIRVTGGISVGGNTFTLDISKKLGVALENAHQLKVLNGLNPGPRQAKISTALEPNLRRITTEAKRVMRYYNERISPDSRIEQMLIVGSGSNLPGIGEFFTNELIMPARTASPWQQLDFGGLAQPAKQFRPRYITVAGLASLKFDEVWG